MCQRHARPATCRVFSASRCITSNSTMLSLLLLLLLWRQPSLTLQLHLHLSPTSMLLCFIILFSVRDLVVKIMYAMSYALLITFPVSRRRREMYIGHARLCVCLSLAAFPHYCTDSDVSWGNGRMCPVVVHYWVDLQSVHGFRRYDNMAPNAKCQPVLVLALCLVCVLLSASR